MSDTDTEPTSTLALQNAWQTIIASVDLIIWFAVAFGRRHVR